MRRNIRLTWLTKLVLVIVISWFSCLVPVHATSLSKETIAIQKLAQRDMKAAHGKWSVKVTRLNKRPLKMNTGNQKIGKQRAASTIKVFVMLSVYDKAKRHQLKLSAKTKTDLKLMIHNSDNAATNRLIHRVGGIGAVNKIVKKFQFKNTILKRYMLDLKAINKGKDNYTTAVDLTSFLRRVYQRQLLGPKYDSKMLALLQGCKNHSKLPKLVRGAKVYNKTGEFPTKGVQNDAALFKTKQGVYTVVVMAQSGNQYYQYQGMNRLGRDVVNYLDKHK